MPPFAACRNNIDVALKQERRAIASTVEPRDQGGALGLARRTHLTAETLQQSPDPLDQLTLIARGVGRVEAQQPLRSSTGRS